MDLLSASFSIIAFSTSKLILDFTPWFDLFSIEINHVILDQLVLDQLVLVRGFLISSLGWLQQVISNAILNMAFFKLSCVWSEIAIIIKTTLLDIFIFQERLWNWLSVTIYMLLLPHRCASHTVSLNQDPWYRKTRVAHCI